MIKRFVLITHHILGDVTCDVIPVIQGLPSVTLGLALSCACNKKMANGSVNCLILLCCWLFVALCLALPAIGEASFANAFAAYQLALAAAKHRILFNPNRRRHSGFLQSAESVLKNQLTLIVYMNT